MCRLHTLLTFFVFPLGKGQMPHFGVPKNISKRGYVKSAENLLTHARSYSISRYTSKQLFFGTGDTNA